MKGLVCGIEPVIEPTGQEGGGERESPDDSTDPWVPSAEVNPKHGHLHKPVHSFPPCPQMNLI